ncbi:MAG TPA: Slp family lipoprotein [Candidatus Margulisiibacteriota bacterium]|nr:Slp family lipoprotein [Candidatus Margulisiibacteriota bacterium]
MKRAPAWLLLVACALGACAQPPPMLSGGPFSEVSVLDAQARDLTGQRVRWGGSIVATTPEKDETCFEIVSRPLDREARPRRTDESDGRFLACAQGFFDPAVYAAGREATVVGTLETTTVGKIGEYDYRYPRVAAEHVFLWPKREPVEAYYVYGPWPDGFWYPLWGPWPYR